MDNYGYTKSDYGSEGSRRLCRRGADQGSLEHAGRPLKGGQGTVIPYTFVAFKTNDCDSAFQADSSRVGGHTCRVLGMHKANHEY